MNTVDAVIQKLLDIFLFLLEKGLRLRVDESKRLILVQFIKFGIVGLSNTLLSYVIYLGAWKGLDALGFQSTQRYLLAQAISFVLGVLWSFYWNNKLVFASANQTGSLWKSLLKTFISYSFTGLFLNSLLLILWVQVFHLSELIAPLLNLIISVPLNFLLNKYWAFKEK